MDTEGLLLITNDGELNHHLISPAHHIPKTYLAYLDRRVPDEAVELFQNGIDIGDEKPTLPAKLQILPPFTEDNREIYPSVLTIEEGRFHQVKRMFHAVGCEVIYLKRISMGSLSLDGLKKGEYRSLTPEEVSRLKK